jgi:hypothetical protein
MIAARPPALGVHVVHVQRRDRRIDAIRRQLVDVAEVRFGVAERRREILLRLTVLALQRTRTELRNDLAARPRGRRQHAREPAAARADVEERLPGIDAKELHDLIRTPCAVSDAVLERPLLGRELVHEVRGKGGECAGREAQRAGDERGANGQRSSHERTPKRQSRRAEV